MSNQETEDAAIAYVIQRERHAGRNPRDTRHQGAPVDIESPPRLIEVKAYGKSARSAYLWFEAPQMEEALRNPNVYVYVVENVDQGDPEQFTLKVLGGDRLARLLKRRKERRHFEVPWPVAEYDTCPSTVD